MSVSAEKRGARGLLMRKAMKGPVPKEFLPEDELWYHSRKIMPEVETDMKIMRARTAQEEDEAAKYIEELNEYDAECAEAVRSLWLMRACYCFPVPIIERSVLCDFAMLAVRNRPRTMKRGMIC